MYTLKKYYTPDDAGGGWSSSDTAAAAQVAIAGINYASAANTNKKQRKWMEEQYTKQRSDALADWQKQNEYNSPAANMARLKAAGLNPNLVYGDGANSPSVNIRSSDTGSWHPQAPTADLSPAVDSFFRSYDLEQKKAQTDNLKAQRLLIDQQILNTAANTQNVGQTTETAKFNLEQLKLKASTDIAQVKANLDKTNLEMDEKRTGIAKTQADTQYTLDQNERAALMSSQNLSKGLEEIQNLRATRAKTNDERSEIRQRITNLKTDNRLKELDEALKKVGIQPHDPAYIRLGQKLIQAMPTPQKFKHIVDSTIKAIGQKIIRGDSTARKNWVLPNY